MTGYEYFEQILKDKGLKAYDVSKGTGIRSGVFSDWKKCRYTPKIEHFRKDMRKCANADKSALKSLVGMNPEDWYWTLTVAEKRTLWLGVIDKIWYGDDKQIRVDFLV